jgi:AraC-like DNA-binding protein
VNVGLEQSNNSNDASFWSDNALNRTEFLAAHYTSFVFPPHFHESYAIGIIVSGAQRFSQKSAGSTVMPAGKLCVINPGVVHEGRAATDTGWRYRMIYPSQDLVAAALLDGGLSVAGNEHGFDTNVLNDPELYRAFARLHRASQDCESVLERESRCLVFLEVLFTRHAMKVELTQHKNLGHRSVQVVRDYLHANWSSDIRADKLAGLVDCSPTHTIRAFSREIGLPPHRYVLALRVERVKKMMRGGLSLADCAAQAGFYDQSQMTRHFKAFTGVTPGTYLKG